MPTALIVDDDDAVHPILRKVLVHHGFRVLDARDGLAAWLVLASEAGAVDLMFTDLSMPRMDGYELAHLVRRNYPWIAIILMSGYPLQCGFSVLQKLFHPGHVRKIVEENLPPLLETACADRRPEMS